jgi:hypothetical protein
MKLAGDGAHRHPVERHTFPGLTRRGTIALRLHDHWKRQRINEASQAVWIEGWNHGSRLAAYDLGESAWGDCGRGSNHGLAKKSAASSQSYQSFNTVQLASN